MHKSVLLSETVALFAEVSIKRFVDGTLGAGGHSKALLEAHPEIELLIGFDQDPDALEVARKNLASFGEKVAFVHANTRDLEEHLKEPVDGVLLDVGVSSMQFDQMERGFSFKDPTAPLDMRMNKEQSRRASDLLNHLPEEKLSTIFWEYGEERSARKAAKAIVLWRKRNRIETVGDLDKALAGAVRKRGKGHPLTRIYQALRIAVNDEIEALKAAVDAAFASLAPGGRLAVITFHSLEDRIVKHRFLAWKQAKEGRVLTKKPLVPSLEEVRSNRRARSAKLRGIEKL